MESDTKIYVSVTVKCDENGIITPLSFVWEDGTKYIIRKIIARERRASLKAGGIGIRYTAVLDGGYQTYLYHEDINPHKFLWFMEKNELS